MFFKRLRLRRAVTSKDGNMKKIGSKVILKAAYCILQFVFTLPGKCNFIKEKSGNLENCMGPFLESPTVLNLSGLESYVCFLCIQHQSFNSFQKDAVKL